MNIIEKYFFGKIFINGLCYQTDVLIFPNYVQDNWWRKERHLLTIGDLDSVVNFTPEVLIIGTGRYGLMKIDKNLINELKKFDINKIIIEKTQKACDLYNKETSLKKVAALHLTC